MSIIHNYWFDSSFFYVYEQKEDGLYGYGWGFNNDAFDLNKSFDKPHDLVEKNCTIKERRSLVIRDENPRVQDVCEPKPDIPYYGTESNHHDLLSFCDKNEEDFKGKVESVNNKKNFSKSEPQLEDIFAELDDLVGMNGIKNELQSLVNVIKINQLRLKEGLPQMTVSNHIVFVGPPGTGKTTIARILAKIYKALGVIPTDNCLEVDRSALVAGYVGQTALKTDQIIDEALGGVLFIDEAYSLKRSEDIDSDFGQETIDILLKRMEDYRDKFVVVVAGYPDEMNMFLNSNPGLKSRFNRFIHFNHYTPEELVEIFQRFLNKFGFILSQEAKEKVTSLFVTLYNKRDSRFGNGRLVRNVFEKTFEKHAERTMLLQHISKSSLQNIIDEDIPIECFI